MHTAVRKTAIRYINVGLDTNEHVFQGDDVPVAANETITDSVEKDEVPLNNDGLHLRTCKIYKKLAAFSPSPLEFT